MKFSTRGTTKSILLKYAKGNTNNHKLEVRVSATTVRLIKKFPLFHTGGWGSYTTVHIPIDYFVGVLDMNFVARAGNVVINFHWLEISK